MRCSPHSFHGGAQFSPELRELEAAHMTELDPFTLLPEALARIELRGRGRQALQVDPVGRTVGQALLDDLTARHRSTVLDNDHRA
jgi:hypothetical protein